MHGSSMNGNKLHEDRGRLTYLEGENGEEEYQEDDGSALGKLGSPFLGLETLWDSCLEMGKWKGSREGGEED